MKEQCKPKMNGDELKRWRERNGLTQRELAVALELTTTTISNHENDIRPTRRQFRLALAALENGLEPVGENESD